MRKACKELQRTSKHSVQHLGYQCKPISKLKDTKTKFETKSTKFETKPSKMASNFTDIVSNDTLPSCDPQAVINASLANQTLTNCRPYPQISYSSKPDTLTIILLLFYGLICTIGLLGNGLVIFVIIRYTKMKTVTNLYILNLSIADSLFLIGLPLIMTTALIKHWIFGGIMCKIYYVLTCINMFTGPFTLAVMSGDRFLAVCYPFSSMRYR